MKNHKVSLQQITLICGLILLFAGGFVVYKSVVITDIALHNIDLSYNIALGVNDINNYLLSNPQMVIDNPEILQNLKLNFRDIQDRNSDMVERHLGISYINSINIIDNAILSTVVGTLIFSFGLFLIIAPKIKQKR